jgi:cobalt-zinc-cadmium efflux system outer membrane protein
MDKKRLSFLATVLMVTFSGCASDRNEDVVPIRSSLGREYATYQPPRKASVALSDIPELAEPNGVITLHQALTLALLHNPELAEFSFEIRAAEARALQAGLWPNPEAGVGIENVGGTEEVSGLDGPAMTIQLGQLLVLAGKRAKRRRVALLEGSLAGWDYEATRLDVLRQVAQAYIALLAAQRGVELAADLVRLSEQTYTAVTERVEAGKDPPVEKTKAQVALANAGIELKKATRRLEAARKELVTTWGGKQPKFTEASGDIEQVDPLPQEDALVALLPQNPAIARWQTELEQRKAAVDLEKAGAVPDPTVLGGYRRFNDTGDHAVVFGLAMPLPITDRNQGAIQEAKFNLAKARKQSRAAEAATYAAFASAYETLSAAYAEVMDIRNVVLPGAQSAFEATRQGYEQGKFDFLAVLDSQRTFFDARLRYLDALAGYQKAKAAVESLIGQDLDNIRNALEANTQKSE